MFFILFVYISAVRHSIKIRCAPSFYVTSLAYHNDETKINAIWF